MTQIASGEAAGNFERKDFMLSEAVAIKRTLERAKKAAVKERMVATRASPGKLPELAKGAARDQAAALTGCSARTMDKAIVAIIVDAGRARQPSPARVCLW